MKSTNSQLMTFAVAATTMVVVALGWKKWLQQKQIADSEKEDKSAPVGEVKCNSEDSGAHPRVLSKGTITIAHGSVTGTCLKFANQLREAIQESLVNNSDQNIIKRVTVGNVQEWDWWDELVNMEEDDDNDGLADSGDVISNMQQPTPKKASSKKQPQDLAEVPKLILLLPTYTNGSWTPCAAGSIEMALKEISTDWRIAKFPLKQKLQIQVFGMGSSEYDSETMGQPAKEAHELFTKLGAAPIVRGGGKKIKIGDDSIADHANNMFHTFQQQIIRQLQKQVQPPNAEKATGSAQKPQSPMEEKKLDDADYDDDEQEPEGDDVVDVEDMGDFMTSSENDNTGEPKEMVTPNQATALKKEGYKLIGTHSAVKLCRWTKHQLRGRGGCYKHTFYGITSYQCMEATPSLACANKCVFCWRHHKNPVGKEWKWKTDDPKFIVDEAVQTHVKMIKETKGIPGVRMDRWQEAHTVRHCALSLVGEPIMYPQINELCTELHDRKISTFLVTNGQHPDAIQSLVPITQLYVSVDAPTSESLNEIDRPLFNDAFDRLQQSLRSLKRKAHQRTVARLTVVKGWNTDELIGYAKLIALGHVSLVEIKGVTYCGKSDASNLNMTNTPWHHEVVELTKELKDEINLLRSSASEDEEEFRNIPEYGIACEHKHSCSVLLARVDQFSSVDPTTGERVWKTWINYDKFNELIQKQRADPSFTFKVEDYTADTPKWAYYGSHEEGFDPTDTRHRKNTKHPKYTKFDARGVPTHDHNNNELSFEERQKLKELMDQKIKEINNSGCSVTTNPVDGSKEIQDASLMFRGLVVTK